MEDTHVSYPFPANAIAALNGATVEVTYFKHPQAATAVTATGELVSVNGSGVLIRLASGKHAWVSLIHVVSMEEQ